MIKELGDFTTDLYHRVKIGEEVKVEGPYGRLAFDVNKPQIWIAGGVGVASFFAILASLKSLKRILLCICFTAREVWTVT